MKELWFDQPPYKKIIGRLLGFAFWGMALGWIFELSFTGYFVRFFVVMIVFSLLCHVVRQSEKEGKGT